MKSKLSRITNPRHRLMITVLVNSLLWLSRLKPKRARIHWVGGPRRSRRIERQFMALLFMVAMVMLEPHEFIYWCVLIGGGISLFLNLHTIYSFIPTKQYHWINRKH